MDFDGVPPSPDRPRQVKCGILVYFEPRSAPKKPPLWLKSKMQKPDCFRQEKTGFSGENPRKVQPLTITILSYRLQNVKMIFHLFPAETVSFPILNCFYAESTKIRRDTVEMCTGLPFSVVPDKTPLSGRMSLVYGRAPLPGRILS